MLVQQRQERHATYMEQGKLSYNVAEIGVRMDRWVGEAVREGWIPDGETTTGLTEDKTVGIHAGHFTKPPATPDTHAIWNQTAQWKYGGESKCSK